MSGSDGSLRRGSYQAIADASTVGADHDMLKRVDERVRPELKLRVGVQLEADSRAALVVEQVERDLA
jgi:hypothetical protein